MTLLLKISQLEEFHERWRNKAEEYNSGSLADHFDRFFSLYVIYNRIYNVILPILFTKGEIAILKQESKIKRDGPFDNEIATTCIANFLKERLEQIIHDNEESIEKFKFIIDSHQFNITLNRKGHPQREKDLELFTNLNSSDPFVVVEALLKILYKIRCNVFHGVKGYENEQTYILDPANQCLFYLTDLLMEEIRNLRNRYEVGKIVLD